MKLLDRTKTESVLIFTRTKQRATRLANRMKDAGLPVTSLQGDLSQQQRQKAISGFRSGRYQILVATDIAARGIDVSRISHVINYDTPDTVDAYTHRIGRTGRAAKTGDAFTLVTPKDRSLVWDIENVLGEKMERRTLEGFDYTVPAPEHSGGSGRSFIGGGRQGLTGFRKPPRAQLSAGFPSMGGSVSGSAYGGSEGGPKGKALFNSSGVKARRSWTTRSF
jgi:superfamily II DNA/RNA helicase